MGRDKEEISSYLVNIKPYTTVRWENVIERFNKRLKEHLLNTAYNNISMLFQRQQSTSTFEVDSFANYEQFSSGNCIGLTLGLIQNIINYCRNWEETMTLPPMYVIPATLPAHYGNSEEFGHVALLVVCANGLILLDSGFHIPQGVVLKNNDEVSLQVGDKTWRFRLDPQSKIDDKIRLKGYIHASVESPRFGREEFQYTLRHISNPDGIILKKMTDAHNVSYVRRDWCGLQTSHVTVYGCPPLIVEQIKSLVSSFLEESRQALTAKP
jgi:hypothetical protein